MKKLKIGKIPLNVCENLDDIRYIRSEKFKQYIGQILFNVDIALFDQTMKKYKEAIDKGLHSEGLILWLNFGQSFKLKEPDFDAYGFCFALITSEKGENLEECGTDFLKEKLLKLDKQGLTRQTVEKTVSDFMKAFPLLYLELRGRTEGLSETIKLL